MADTFEKAAQKMADDERARENISAMSDDDVLREWTKATKMLRLRSPEYPGDSLRAPGDPLAETSRLGDAKDVQAGYNGGVYGMPAGSPLDVTPEPGGPASPADGLRWLETPFSALDRDLERTKGTPEYERVKALYGPARIAYHRKNNLDINTGKPK